MGSKRYRKALALVDRKAAYELPKAVTLLKEMPKTKFDESVELSASLNIDPKKSDQLVRGTVVLPHGTGKTRRVIVFCKGEKEIIARQAGADQVGGSELVEKILGGWMDFDVAVATPEMMREVSRLGKLLGPRGMMPNPKTGTVTEDVAKAIGEIKRGRVEFKMDKLANIHLVVGRLSFAPDQLTQNARAALEAIVHARPATMKGKMLRRVVLNSSMSAGIPLEIEELEAASVAEE